MSVSQLIPLVGIPVARSVVGWAENALKDGVVSSFEWKELGQTVLRMGMIGLATFYGLNGMGVDISAFAAGASTVLLDFVLMSIKKVR